MLARKWLKANVSYVKKLFKLEIQPDFPPDLYDQSFNIISTFKRDVRGKCIYPHHWFRNGRVYMTEAIHYNHLTLN